jgi:hypothetical protein
MKKSGQYLLTFGGGSEDFRAAASRVGAEAEAANFFEKIFVVTDKDHESFISSFLKKNQSFIRDNPRGFGLWSWKPHLIDHFLGEIPEGSSLMYLDSGSHLNLKTFQCAQKLQGYFELAKQRGIFAMQLRDGQFGDDFSDLSESAFTTKSLAKKVGLSQEHLSSHQIESNFLIANNSRAPRRIVREWLKLSSIRSHRYLLDPLDADDTFANFFEHRHDQAIFSALLKKHDIEPSLNESYFHPTWIETGTSFPVWVIRHGFGSDPIESGRFG